MSDGLQIPHEPRSEHLGALVTALEEDVSHFAEAIQNRQLAEKLQTRLDELSNPAGSLRGLIAAAELLTQIGLPRLDKRTVGALTTVYRKVTALVTKFQEDPKSITAANAVCTADMEKLAGALEECLLGFWRPYVERGLPNDNLLASFDRHSKYQNIVTQLRHLRSQLSTMASQLPSEPDKVQIVAGLQTQMQLLLSSLPDLTAKVRRFLHDTVATGVTLNSVLEDCELIDWIKSQGLASEFRVYGGTVGSLQRNKR